jgi:hypothetical protein
MIVMPDTAMTMSISRLISFSGAGKSRVSCMSRPAFRQTLFCPCA